MDSNVPCGDIEGFPGSRTQVRVMKWPRLRPCRPFHCSAFLAILLFVVISCVLLFTTTSLQDGSPDGNAGGRDADGWLMFMSLFRGKEKADSRREETIGNLTGFWVLNMALMLMQLMLGPTLVHSMFSMLVM
jgi:hypothetical protein